MPEEETSKKDAGNEAMGKWASEAFSFLRLFQKVGGQVSGLLMLEIGWAILLVFVAKLTLSTEKPVITLPWLSLSPYLELKIREVQLTTLFPVGALIIALIWLFTSGLYLYFSYPLSRFLRIPITIIVVTVYFLLLIVISVIQLPIFLLWEFRYRAWKRKIAPEKLQKIIQEHGVKIVRGLAEKAIGNRTWLFDLGDKLYSKAISLLVPNGSIGLAHLYSYTYAEDLQATKVPMQIFADAVGQMRLKLGSLQVMQLMRFHTLPPIWKVTTEDRARHLRKWFGFDALLWGSYLSVDPPKIWLNIEQALSEQKEEKPTERTNSYESRWNLYNDPLYYDDIYETMMVVDQNDPFDAFIALTIGLILSLRAREKRKFALFLKGFDQLSRLYGEDEALLIHLIRDTLFRIDELPPSALPYPVAKQVLIRLASNWVMKQVEYGSYAAVTPNDDYKVFKNVLEKCIKLEPDIPKHRFRLAVMQCLLENEEGARRTLKEALEEDEKDRGLHWINEDYIFIDASVDFSLLDIESNSNVRLARAAVHTFRGVKVGGEVSKVKLRDDFLKTTAYKFIWLAHKSQNMQPPTVSERIILECLDIDPLVQPPIDPEDKTP